MSAPVQTDVAALLEKLEKIELAETDNENLESSWHRDCIGLLIGSILWWFRDRSDFYVGGNMFLYYSLQQAMNRDFHGPDFFYVEGANLHPRRPYWATWLEGGRTPDVVIELLSPTTAKEDRTTKRQIYERILHTNNYFFYDPFTNTLEGWELVNRHYRSLEANERGWLWSSVLQLWVGTWEGEYLRENATWLRFYDPAGKLVDVQEEVAERAAHAERQRAEAAEAELARLRAQLAQQTGNGGRPE